MIQLLSSVPQAESATPGAPGSGLAERIVYRAFASQPPEAFLMLRLLHIDQLTPGDIARMWGCDERMVLAVADAARRRIASEILSGLRQHGMPLAWAEVVELCDRSSAHSTTGEDRRLAMLFAEAERCAAAAEHVGGRR